MGRGLSEANGLILTKVTFNKIAVTHIHLSRLGHNLTSVPLADWGNQSGGHGPRYNRGSSIKGKGFESLWLHGTASGFTGETDRSVEGLCQMPQWLGLQL